MMISDFSAQLRDIVNRNSVSHLQAFLSGSSHENTFLICDPWFTLLEDTSCLTPDVATALLCLLRGHANILQILFYYVLCLPDLRFVLFIPPNA